MMLGAAALAAGAVAADPRFVLYFDQYHTTLLPNQTQTEGINYVITAFANSSLFTTDPAGEYTPFKPLTEVRAMFAEGTKVCMAIGGWGDTDGFGKGAASDKTRKLWAKNVATTLDKLGYDCVDIDWEYPGGNGADYKQIPNSKKTSEIQSYPKLLKEIKAAIGDKELSIAVPGLERDMIAYTAEQVPKINTYVDFVNLMTYDFMNRRDNYTKHHADLASTIKTVDTYVARGFDIGKLNVGIPFYAKFFSTKAGVTCTGPTGCPTELLEAADGTDTGKSGAFTFEKANYETTPTNLTTSVDNSCGLGTYLKCGESQCCSQYGWCGNTTAHCDTGCQTGYGRCESVDTKTSFQKAMTNGVTDQTAGGQWYWDSEASLYWTWDTPELIEQKLNTLLARGCGGIMAWSLAEDTYDWSHLKAMQNAFKAVANTVSTRFFGFKSHLNIHLNRR